MSNPYVNSALDALNTKFGSDYEFSVSNGGRKYHRIVARNRTQNGDTYGGRSFMFIENASGNVYKCAGWNAPAKIVRHASESPEELAQWLIDNADPHGSFLYIR